MLTADELAEIRRYANSPWEDGTTTLRQLLAHIDALTADLGAERALADELADTLMSLEHSAPDPDYPDEVMICGQCGMSRYIGHADDCLIGWSLARYRAARGA